MDKKIIASLLKLVAIFIGAVLLFAGLYLVPAHMRFLQRLAPEIGPMFIGVLLYINLSFAPVYCCLVLAWQVFSTIGRDDAFCSENVKRLKLATLMPLADVLMVIGFFLFVSMRLPALVDPVFAISSLCLVFVGLSASIVCFALRHLVAQATALKEEVDLTV